MARIIELFMLVNAVAGIATFLGLRFVWRRSRNAAKRGFDVVHEDKEPCPVCEQKFFEDELFLHVYREHPEAIEKRPKEGEWKQIGSPS